jgi:FkbM family methyltransferase
MSKRIRTFINNLCRTQGYEIRKLDSIPRHWVELVAALKYYEIDLLLDVGANAGQFAKAIRKAGYSGRIVSFEPLSSAHEKLALNASRDPEWEVYPRAALGDRNGEISINIAGNSVSSSVLGMLTSHSDVASDSKYVGAESVPLYRLDHLLPLLQKDAKRVFLKLDTQGFEAQVIDGAEGVLGKIEGIHCEMSMLPLYEGQTLWQDMLAKFYSKKFTLWNMKSGFSNPQLGRMLQFDATLFRQKE